jgi:galactokinase
MERAEKSGAVQGRYNQRAGDCARGLEHLSDALRSHDLPASTNYPTLLATHGSERVLATAERVLTGRLLARVRHTISESVRVDRAVEAMQKNDRVSFGKLMIASHTSLRDDYDVSIHALDDLVDIMLNAGCDGARLTGAGFGGCVVGLCTAERVGEVRESLAAEFYAPRHAMTDSDDRVFVAEPSDGARVTDGRTI